MNKKIHINIVILLVGIFVGFLFFKNLPEKENIYQLPQNKLISENQTQFACKSITSTYLSENLLGEIVSSSEKGTDEVSIFLDRVNGKLNFFTKADLRSGATKPMEWDIIFDNNEHLFAVWVDPTNNYLATLTFDLEKNNAIWTKGGLGLKMDGQSFFLDCR